MSQHSHLASNEQGFSLVELMIALLIGLIISVGVVQIFSATRATYQLDESLARAQENGRFALEFLTHDVRHAGYAGCKRDTTITVFNNLAYTAQPGLPIIGISGAEYGGTGYGSTYTLAAAPVNSTSGWLPSQTGIAGVPGGFSAVAATGALPGTDILVLQRMVPNSWALAAPYITPDRVYIDPNFVSEVKDRDILLVADCRNAVVFMVTGAPLPSGEISHTAGATTNRCERWTGGLDTANAASAACASPFDYDPESSTAMGKLETVVFFVANDNASGTNRPTLFRRVMLATGGAVETTALVEGVENFQVLYGVDDAPPFDGAADRYVTANNVSNFARVVSVQIGLLVYGVNTSGTRSDLEFDTDTHDVAGTSVIPEPNSARKRRVFNTTIQLRNRNF